MTFYRHRTTSKWLLTTYRILQTGTVRLKGQPWYTELINGKASPNPTAGNPQKEALLTPADGPTAGDPRFARFHPIPPSLNYEDVMGTLWLFKILHRQQLSVATSESPGEMGPDDVVRGGGGCGEQGEWVSGHV